MCHVSFISGGLKNKVLTKFPHCCFKSFQNTMCKNNDSPLQKEIGLLLPLLCKKSKLYDTMFVILLLCCYSCKMDCAQQNKES